MAEKKQTPVAVIVGVEPGLGASLARRFAQEYAVALIARNADYLQSLAGEIRAVGGHVLAVPADIGDRTQVEAAFATIRKQLGSPEVLLYNTGSGTWGPGTELTPERYEDSGRVNAYSAFISAKAVVPDLIEHGRGVILFTGATAGVKAGPESVAPDPTKLALRGLAQSLAWDLGPKGIHVAWINVDGIIDMPKTREHFPQLQDEDLLGPNAITETYWHLAHQHRSESRGNQVLVAAVPQREMSLPTWLS